jgi:hypothetical protein
VGITGIATVASALATKVGAGSSAQPYVARIASLLVRIHTTYTKVNQRVACTDQVAMWIATLAAKRFALSLLATGAVEEFNV